MLELWSLNGFCILKRKTDDSSMKKVDIETERELKSECRQLLM